jgi:ABC-type Co2+ transport system permease subunit
LAVCFLGFALPVMVVCCCGCCCRSNQNQNKRKTPQDQLLQAFLTLLVSLLDSASATTICFIQLGGLSRGTGTSSYR